MARFVSLYSGSSGNAFYAGGKNAGVLIDIGVSYRALVNALNSCEIPLSNIKALFITHEHSDHIKGIETFLKRNPSIPIYASLETLTYISEHSALPSSARLIEISQNAVCEADMCIEAFDTPHDALHSLGFKIRTSDDRAISIATDLGHLDENIIANLLKSDLVLLESNYDKDMLRFGPYPYVLKRRISGELGHLSNDECSSVLPMLVDSGVSRIVLAHLSEQNNRPDIAENYARSSLDDKGYHRGRDYLLEVAPRFNPGKIIIF